MKQKQPRTSEATEPNSGNLCPVCGYDGLAKPAYSAKGYGSHEICPSCGFQFDVSDTKGGWSFSDWRKRWVSNGMNWSSTVIKPPRNWNRQNQVGRVMKRYPR
jgi:hypothetical protein